MGHDETIAKAESFLADRKFSLQTLIEAKGFDKLAQLQTAATLEEKKTFQTYASELSGLFKFSVP